MSTVAAPPRLTPDDLLRMPDEGQGFELVDGQLKELNVSRQSTRVAALICGRLEAHFTPDRPAWVYGEGTSYRCFPGELDRVRRADVSVIAYDRMTVEEYAEDGHTLLAPDLAVEVISPNDLSYETEEKLDDWLSAGTKVVWIVHPVQRTVRVHRADGGYAFLREADTLPPDPVLLGFTAPVATLLRLPTDPLA